MVGRRFIVEIVLGDRMARSSERAMAKMKVKVNVVRAHKNSVWRLETEG